jgi:hypothetical protein
MTFRQRDANTRAARGAPTSETPIAMNHGCGRPDIGYVEGNLWFRLIVPDLFDMLKTAHHVRSLARRIVMRSFQCVAMGFALSALMAAGPTGAEDESLGVRLVNQMNALYGRHPGVRANHAKGAVFEGTFTPAQGADALSSAVFLKGAPTPLVIRFSNAGGVPDAPDTDPSTDRIRGMAIKFHLPDRSEQDMI